MTRQDFVNQYGGLITAKGKETGLYPEIIFSQAFIEGSDGKGKFGESYTMKNGNNIFNLKPGTSWTGATIVHPFVKTESNTFRAYGSLEDSVKDYFNFIGSNKRYKAAGVFNAHSLEEQAKALQTAHFAGNSTTYADTIIAVSKQVQGLLGKAVKKAITTAGNNWPLFLVPAALVAIEIAREKKWVKF